MRRVSKSFPTPCFVVAWRGCSWCRPVTLHDALPIWCLFIMILVKWQSRIGKTKLVSGCPQLDKLILVDIRSEEHTSELQSQSNLVCRLLLEKKKRAFQRPVSSSRGGAAHGAGHSRP